MAAEIVRRLAGRAHLILLATASLPDDPGTVVPVAFKVAHEIKQDETEPKLVDLVGRLDGSVQFEDRRVLYTWIGGTRRDWRGQGHFRALTEQQELWAIDHGFDEIVVKTKNKFYEMRGTLDHLHFEVVKYERDATDNAESKVYLSKRLANAEVVDPARRARTDQVFFGATVTCANARDEERTVKIVGVDEVDLAKGHVSWISPIAKALLRAEEGDVVRLRTPAGVEELEIVKVEYV